MQKTVDILKNIVITDNNIFLETRRLINIKDDEKQKFQNLAVEYDKQVSAYIGTINKLQKENEKLKKELKKIEGSDHNTNIFLYIALAVIAVLGSSSSCLFPLLNPLAINHQFNIETCKSNDS